MVVALREAIDTGAFEKVLSAISQFSCQDNDVETFLKSKAIDFEKRDKSRTYLVFDDSSMALLGYYTLSLKALPFNQNVSKSTVKSIDGFSKDIRAVGIVLIGQFGKDYTKAKHIDGDYLFNICLETVYRVQDLIGGRFVMLECHEIEKVVEFYKRQGFESLQYDETDKYLQMIRRL